VSKFGECPHWDLVHKNFYSLVYFNCIVSKPPKWCDSEKFISKNDKGRSAMSFYIQQKGEERELDSRERERVCV